MGEQKRDGFVFYRSYYEAIQNLPEKDRLAVYEAIFSYALNDEETETVGVPAAVFMLVKPTLDASKRKAASGKAGGEASARANSQASGKQTESKSEAKRKQRESKTKANEKQTVSKAEAIKDKGQETRDEGQGMKDTTTLSASQPEAACPFGKIRDLYHELCPSFPHLRSIDGERRKAVAARWRQYKSLDTFEELFRFAESSSFLKGQNDRNWHADFDWMMKATNFVKILEHKYDDKPASKPTGALGVLAKLYEEAGNDQAGSG